MSLSPGVAPRGGGGKALAKSGEGRGGEKGRNRGGPDHLKKKKKVKVVCRDGIKDEKIIGYDYMDNYEGESMIVCWERCWKLSAFFGAKGVASVESGDHLSAE